MRPSQEHSGNPSSADVFEDFADRIGTEWAKFDKDAFRLSALCHEARSRIPLHDRVVLIGRVGLNKSTFSKLVRIHQEPRFQVAAVRVHLPNNYPALDAIRRLTDYQLAAALEDKAIRPDMRRSSLNSWLRDRSPPKFNILYLLVSHSESMGSHTEFVHALVKAGHGEILLQLVAQARQTNREIRVDLFKHPDF